MAQTMHTWPMAYDPEYVEQNQFYTYTLMSLDCDNKNVLSLYVN